MCQTVGTIVNINCKHSTLQWKVTNNSKQVTLEHSVKANLQQINEIEDNGIQIISKINISQNFEIKYLRLIQHIYLLNKYITITMDPHMPLSIECIVDHNCKVQFYIAYLA